MSEKQFSEDAVREIIRLAMEQEREETEESGTEHGLTLSELVSIGKDVGLSEQDIKAAAKKFRSSPLTKKSRTTNTSNIEERVFSSNLSKDELWDFILGELDDHFGETTMLGALIGPSRDYQWKHMSGSGVETIASLRKIEDKYKLRISQTVGMMPPIWEGILIGIIPAVLLTIGAVLTFKPNSIPLLVLLGAGCWGISSYVTYRLDLAWRKKKQRQLKEITNALFQRLPIGDTASEKSSGIEIEDESVYGIKEKGESETDSPIQTKV